MTADEKIDVLMNKVTAMEETLKQQGEQLTYIVERLNHMRDKAHAERDNKTSWPKG